MKWTIEYDNDTGPRDESFREWWDVICGDTSFRCNSESEANWLCDLLNSQPEIKPPTPLREAAQGNDGISIDDLKLLRNYFGENDKTPHEHMLFAIADKLVKYFTG